MPVRVALHLLSVGHCRHCERVTIQGGGLGAAVFPSIAALIIHPTFGPILYDTGYADHFFDSTQGFPEKLYRWVTPVCMPEQEKLQNQLQQHGVSLSDIGLCLISHFHADHIAGLRDLPQASFMAMKSEFQYISRMGRLRGLLNAFLPQLLPVDFQSRLSFAEDSRVLSLDSPWSVLGEAYDLLGDGSLRAVNLAGHSAGQMGLLLTDEQDREVLLCADAVWSRNAFLQKRYPSMLVRSITHNWPAYKQVIDRLHGIAVSNPELCILPSHCIQSLDEYQRSWLQG